MSETVVTDYLVTLTTPHGVGQLEVPTTLGPNAAARRAIVAAMQWGWGNFDNLTVESVEEL